MNRRCERLELLREKKLVDERVLVLCRGFLKQGLNARLADEV